MNLALPAEVCMLMTVHDSVLLELPEHLVAETRQQVIDAMQTLPSGFTVPITADVGTGRTWAECKTGNIGCPVAA
jgi:DNA polymerase I-like protein with 3'-5' exonuclease and polymerase domains